MRRAVASISDLIRSKLAHLFSDLDADIRTINQRAETLFMELCSASNLKAYPECDNQCRLEEDILDLIEYENQEILYRIFIGDNTAGLANLLERYRQWKEGEEWLGSLPLHRVIARRLHKAGLVVPFNQESDSNENLIINAYQLVAEDLRGFITYAYAHRRPFQIEELEADNKSKFASAELKFLGLAEFHKGLESRIGLPSTVSFIDSMEEEHNTVEDPNYPELNPKLEWDIVMNGYTGQLSTYKVHKKRDIKHALNHYMTLHAERVKEANVNSAEMAALRLWTGPMHKLYTALYRKDGVDFKSSRYTTTLHAINSGISKIARSWTLPLNRKVFRGYSGAVLSDTFLIKDVFGCTGGVEPSVLATTTDWDTAVFYSLRTGEKTAAIIFEIEVGQVDRGANIGWLSQFPHEEEILFNALSNLEVMGKPYQAFTDKGSVLVYPVRVSVNLKSKTLDEFSTTRKVLHLHLVQHLVCQAQRYVHEQKTKMRNQTKSSVQTDEDLPPSSSYLSGLLQFVFDNISEHCEQIKKRHEGVDIEVFNTGSEQYLGLVKEAVYILPRAERLIRTFICGFPWQGNDGNPIIHFSFP